MWGELSRRVFLQGVPTGLGLLGTGAVEGTERGRRPVSTSPPDVEWDRRYERDSDLFLEWMDAVGDGYFATGFQTADERDGYSIQDAWWGRFDDRGYLTASGTRGSRDSDLVEAALLTPNDDVLVCGYRGLDPSSSQWSSAGWVWRTSPSGDLRWSRTYSGSNYASFSDVVEHPAGGYVLVGFTDGRVESDDFVCDGWLLAIDGTGDVRWETRRRTNGESQYRAITQTATGGFLAAGGYQALGSSTVRPQVARVSSSGTVAWVRTYEHVTEGDVEAIHLTSDGTFLVAVSNPTDGVAYVLELDGEGDVLQVGNYGSGDWRFVDSIVSGPDGGYLCSGYQGTSDDYDPWVFKLTDAGELEWTKTFPHRKRSHADWTTALDDGGYLLAGYTDYGSSDDADGWAMKLEGRGRPSLDVTTRDTTATAGDTVDVSFTVENSGSASATDVEVGLATPDGWSIVEWTGETGRLNRSNGTWALSSLPANRSVDVTVTVRVPPGADGTYDVSGRASAENAIPVVTTADVSISASPSLSLTHVRPVQTVERSFVDAPGVSFDVEDPDMVATRPTSVLFTFEAENAAAIAPDDRVDVTVTTDSGVDETFTLDGETVRLLSYPAGGNPEQVNAAAVFGNAAESQRPPVFSLDAETSTLSVRVGRRSGSVDGDAVTLEAGSDFAIAETKTLRVGFIEVEAPTVDASAAEATTAAAETTTAGAETATARTATRTGGGSTTDAPDDAASDDGFAYAYADFVGGRLATKYARPGGDDFHAVSSPDEKLELVVETARAYLRRTFPVEDVETLVHPSRMTGTERKGHEADDLRVAHDLLEDEFEDLDATVALVPLGYFGYHGAGGIGVELGHAKVFQTQTATAVMDVLSLGVMASTVAQEVGHHTEGLNAYPKPIAQRRAPESGSTPTLDRSHARTEDQSLESAGTDRAALRSTAFDLWDRTFRTLHEGCPWGFWGRGRRSFVDQDDGWALGSFMSYGDDDVWADGHVYQRMIDDNFAPTPRVFPASREDVPLLSGTANVDDDGSVEVVNATRRTGTPTPSDDDGVVELSVDAPDGSTLDSRRMPEGFYALGHGGTTEKRTGLVPFAVPYPETAARITVSHRETDTESTLNPVEFTLRSAIGAVPSNGFTDDPEERRDDLLSLVEDVDDHMEDNEYVAASDVLETLASTVETSLRDDYDATANRPTKADLRSLVDEAQTRANELAKSPAAVVRDDGGDSLPSWVPLVGGGALTLGLGGALYRYLERDDAPSGAGERRDDRPDSQATRAPERGEQPAPRRTSDREATGPTAARPRTTDGPAADQTRPDEAPSDGRSTTDEGSARGRTGGDSQACPACGSSVHPDAAFCTECGGNLDDHAASDAWSECPACGSSVHPDAAFCTECGAPR